MSDELEYVVVNKQAEVRLIIEENLIFVLFESMDDTQECINDAMLEHIGILKSVLLFLLSELVFYDHFSLLILQ